jgi:hypothetical protein
MPRKLTKPQRAAMIWMSRGWKAYVAHGTQVEINGKPVCKTDTMAVLEAEGLIEREGVAAWKVTDAGRAWRDPS